LIQFTILKSIYNFFSPLNILLVLLLFLISAVNIFETSYGQSTILEIESETTITSYLDALIKAPVLISQGLVVGMTFVNSFLLVWIMKKESIFFNNNDNERFSFLLALFTINYL
jgi:hypothetical protein